MNKKGWVITGVAVLIVLMVGVSVYRQVFTKGPSVETAQVKEGEVSSTLMIPGTLKLQDDQKVYISQENMKSAAILVQEGQQVKKGDVLVKLNNDQVQSSVSQSNLAISAANAKIDQIQKQVDDLNVRLAKLSDQIGAEDAKKQLNPEFEQLVKEKQAADEELKQAQNQKNSIAKSNGGSQITSLLDGTVLSVREQDNENAAVSAASQEPVIVIGNLDAMIATGALSEYDTLKVKEGLKVILTSDAVPGEKWTGEVQKIGIMPQGSVLGTQGESQAVQYPVTVKITSPISLKPGFQLIMEIETETKKGLVIPADALLGDGEKSYVYILDGNKAQKKEVEVGISSGEKVEIVKGLKEKDIVIVNPPKDITDGMGVSKK